MFRASRFNAVTLAAGLVGASLIGVTSASGTWADMRPEPMSAPTASQRFSWEWVGGSTATERTFTQAQYANKTSKIALKVKVRPPRPPHKVALKVFQGGKWRTHESAKTSSYTGKARLAIKDVYKRQCPRRARPRRHRRNPPTTRLSEPPRRSPGP